MLKYIDKKLNDNKFILKFREFDYFIESKRKGKFLLKSLKLIKDKRTNKGFRIIASVSKYYYVDSEININEFKYIKNSLTGEKVHIDSVFNFVKELYEIESVDRFL